MNSYASVIPFSFKKTSLSDKMQAATIKIVQEKIDKIMKSIESMDPNKAIHKQEFGENENPYMPNFNSSGEVMLEN